MLLGVLNFEEMNFGGKVGLYSRKQKRKQEAKLIDTFYLRGKIFIYFNIRLLYMSKHIIHKICQYSQQKFLQQLFRIVNKIQYYISKKKVQEINDLILVKSMIFLEVCKRYQKESCCVYNPCCEIKPFY